LLNRHRAKQQKHPRPLSSRALASRQFRERAVGIAPCRCVERPMPIVPAIARCRRASSRNAVPATARPPNSARNRRRGGRKCRPRSCVRANVLPFRKNAGGVRGGAGAQWLSKKSGLGKFGRAAQPAINGIEHIANLDRSCSELL